MTTTGFTDKVAFITGAGVGIGRATALAFAEAGADVALVSIDEDDLNETARLIRDTGRRAHTVVADVSDGSAVRAAVSSTVEEFGRIDFAVNNAGIEQPPTPLAETEEGDWNRLLAVNLTGVFLAMKHEIPAMRESGGGAIVNLSSGAGVVGISG